MKNMFIMFEHVPVLIFYGVQTVTDTYPHIVDVHLPPYYTPLNPPLTSKPTPSVRTDTYTHNVLYEYRLLCVSVGECVKKLFM